MKRGRNLVWVLAVLATSACEETPTDSGTCAPYCNTPGTVVTGDSSTGAATGLPEAGGAFDAGGTSASPDAGNVVLVDGSLAPRDAGNGVDGSSVIGNADASNADASNVDASNAGDSGGGSDASTGMGSTLPAVTDYAKPGPFKTATQANVGPNNNYTIFRPEPLGENGFIHSPIIFGPGIITSADMYSSLLTHFASHGFVTISVNSMWGGPRDAGNLSDMKMGLDWLIAQNDQAGVFKGKLAVNRAITMGYSIGATASVELSSHKAIMTTVVIHGHETKGDPHGPVLMITGTSDVIDEMKKTMTTLEKAPAVLVALPIGHLDVPTELALLTQISPTARYVAPITAWLRYWVNGDQGAKHFFWGDSCDVCKSPWIAPEPNAQWKALTP